MSMVSISVVYYPGHPVSSCVLKMWCWNFIVLHHIYTWLKIFLYLLQFWINQIVKARVLQSTWGGCHDGHTNWYLHAAKAPCTAVISRLPGMWAPLTLMGPGYQLNVSLGPILFLVTITVQIPGKHGKAKANGPSPGQPVAWALQSHSCLPDYC